MKRNKIWIGLLGLITLMACENDPFFYNDEARVRIVGPEEWTLETDSLIFSFANYSSAVEDTTFDITVYVMGETSEVDRVASFGIDESLTSADATLFEFPASVTVPAGSFEASLPVTIKRGEVLKENSVTLYVQVLESTDFKVGVDSDDHLLIRWSDILTKPTNWEDLEEFFGAYSQVKYQFIIDTLNIATFDLDEITWGQMKNYQIQLAEALRVYNEEHPESLLTDEDGNLVSFD